MIALFSVLLALASLLFLVYPADHILLFLPIISLVGWRFCGRDINFVNASMFAFYLLTSSFAILMGQSVSNVLGAIAYAYFVSAALVAVAEYLVEKNDT